VARLRTSAALIAALVALTATVAAQTLPRLHIVALGMHTDKRTVVAGQPFHVTIHVAVTEKRAALDELILPTLSNAVELGRESRREPGPRGTDFYQTLTVAASTAGQARFTAAYIDAIDPSSGKALRYSSDPLTVAVTAAAPFDAVARNTRATLGSLGAIVGGTAVIVLVLAFAIGMLRGKRRRPAAVDRSQPAAPLSMPLELPSDDPLRDAIAMVRSRGDDAAMDTLRIVLFARAGLGSGATLADVERAAGDSDRQYIRTLRAAEYARFAPAAERPAATRRLLQLLYDYANGVETPA
jgi:hypothetical protein